jgi:hypothetical protein
VTIATNSLFLRRNLDKRVTARDLPHLYEEVSLVSTSNRDNRLDRVRKKVPSFLGTMLVLVLQQGIVSSVNSLTSDTLISGYEAIR